jgi:sugar lactone lactonase YvrE
MAAGRDGTVYVVQRGVITRYEGATGRRLGEIRGPLRYDDVFVALDGTLWATGDRTEVAHLTAGGDVLSRADLADAIGSRVHSAAIAASGAGDVYVSDRFSGEIYRLDGQGRFQDRFGGHGEADGNIRMPSGLAVDGQGRLYVSDPGRGIRVFDRTGAFLDSFAGGVVFGLAFNDKDELYAAHRNEHAVVVWRVMSDE